MEIKKDQSITETMNLVAKDLSIIGLGKNQENIIQRYKYRGIDPLYDLMAPILAKHGLIILPSVQEYNRENGVTPKGTPTITVHVKVEYRFIHVHNDQYLTAITYGEALDTSDKATNKAITAAYKYMVIMTFNIPINGSDGVERDNNDADNPTLELPKIKDATLSDVLKLYSEIRDKLPNTWIEKLDRDLNLETKQGDLNKIWLSLSQRKTK